MTRKIFASALTVIALISAVGGSALAIFLDTESIPGNTISTGSVDLSLSDGTGHFPGAINAEGLLPGDWSDWSRVKAKNNSNTSVKLYYYITDLAGVACSDTNLEVATGPLGGNEKQFSVFSGNIGLLNGADSKVEVTGYVFDPAVPSKSTAVVQLRAGLDENASESSMEEYCSWTSVFVAIPFHEEEEEPEPPVSSPVSFPEEPVEEETV